MAPDGTEWTQDDRNADALHRELRRLQRKGGTEHISITSIRFKADIEFDGEVLAVLKGTWEDIPVISFHSGYGLVEVMLSMVKRISRDDLKWKADEWEMKNDGYARDSIKAASERIKSLQAS